MVEESLLGEADRVAAEDLLTLRLRERPGAEDNPSPVSGPRGRVAA